MARFGQVLITLALLGAFIAVIGLRWLNTEIQAPGPLTAEKLVYIEPGSSIKAVTLKLLDAGVIQNNLAFMIEARLENYKKELQAGEYQFPAQISIQDTVTLLQSGKTYQRQITIPEGLMTIEILELLKNETALTGTVEPPPPEGSLLPETYNFSYGDTRQSLVGRMKTAMQKELDTLWQSRNPETLLKTPQEAVTLASIVEKETGLAAERPRVAGVFINRLRKHIPLQSDPTVIYAVTEGKEKFERALTFKDLKSPSPYNTYMAVDLPPTPIANPGKASLAAVFNPEKNDYIYFVADGTGGHAFAKTLKEHNNNVARWRKIQKNAK